MAAFLNKVQFIGYIGREVEFRDHGNGFVTAQFRLATTESWREEGQRRERTDWHRIEARGRLAEIVRDILGQGDQVYVEGKLQHDKVESKSEPGKFDYFTKIVADTVQKLGKRERADDAEGDGNGTGAGERDGDAGVGEQGGGAGGERNGAPAASAASAPSPTPAPGPAPAPAARAASGGAAKWRTRGTK